MHHYIKEVEEYTYSLKLQLEEERKDLQECHQKFSSLLNTFKKNLTIQDPYMKTVNQFNYSAPTNSLLHTIFKDDEPSGLILQNDQEARRKKLAAERRAEYNAYLQKKENELLQRKKTVEDKSNVTPRSLLEFVDYDQLLAKRKEEETVFRNLNRELYIEPHFAESKKAATNSISHLDNSHELLMQNIDNTSPLVDSSNSQLLQEAELSGNIEKPKISATSEPQGVKIPASFRQSSEEVLPMFRRTGGGGDPVRDLYGNLITVRGFRENQDPSRANTVSLPFMKRSENKNKNMLYKEELQRQIEEKKRLEALEKERLRLLEEKLAQKSEEQRLKMQKEYEMELQRTNKLKDDFLRQQERIKQLEEFQRKHAETRKKKLVQSRALNGEIPSPSAVGSSKRSPSPPVPAVRTKELVERTITPTQHTIGQVKPGNLFSSLAEIRRQILQEQQKVKKDVHSYEVMNRRTVPDVIDDEAEELVE